MAITLAISINIIAAISIITNTITPTLDKPLTIVACSYWGHTSLSRYYQLTDNIVLNFKPLRTDSMTNAELQAHYESLEVGSYTVNA